MKLEGKIAGPWVSECDRTWRALIPSLGSKKLRIDLCGVSNVDAKGRELLNEMHKKGGADFWADTPMSKYFAQQAQNENREILREED